MGFPLRLLRQSFGPLEVLAKRLTIWPDRELGPELMKLLLWQLSGSGLGSSLCWGKFTSSGSNPTFVAGGSAWRPDDQSFANPATKTRSGAGVYEIAYSSTYLDHRGVAQPLALSAAIAFPQGTADQRAVASVRVDGRTIDVNLRNSAGAGVDGTFLVVAF
jgi:hypothetical protein